MIDQNINSIKVREIYTSTMLTCLEIDLILNSGACSRIHYPYYSLPAFTTQINQLIGKNSSIYAIDSSLMRMKVDQIFPLSILSALAGAASINQSLRDYITSQMGSFRSHAAPNLMIPLWSKDTGTLCRSLFVILDSLDDLNFLLDIKPFTIDIDDMILQGKLGEVLLYLQKTLGSKLGQYKLGMHINLGEYEISDVGMIIKALPLHTIIDTYNPKLSSQKILLHHRYSPELRIISDIQDDEYSSTDIYIHDKDIITLSYVMDCVNHLTDKNKSCILIHRDLQGLLASVLVDISCALGVTDIYISNPHSEAAANIYNQLIRMR
jgi:hypothetical protein